MVVGPAGTLVDAMEAGGAVVANVTPPGVDDDSLPHDASSVTPQTIATTRAIENDFMVSRFVLGPLEQH